MKNGVGETVFDNKSDIQKLIDTLNKGFGFQQEGSEDGKAKGKQAQGGSIPPKPKVADFNGMIGNLGLTIPTGFVMLHNDLEAIIKNTKKMSGGSTADKVTAVATSITAATSLISALKSPAGLGDILDNSEVNNRLAMDSSVYSVRLKGTKGYLQAYYMDLVSKLGYRLNWKNGNVTRDRSLKSLLTTVAGTVGTVIGSSVEGVMRSINNSKAQQAVESSADVQGIRRIGTIGYLKAYYSNLVHNLGYKINWKNGNITRTPNISALLGNIGKAIGGIIGSAVDTTAQALHTSSAQSAIESDSEVQFVRKKGTVGYLKAYYSNLANNLGYSFNWRTGNIHKTLSISSFVRNLGNSLGNVIGGVVDSVGHSIVNTAGQAKIESDSEVQAVRKKGTVGYLQAYYMNLVTTLGYTLNWKTGKVKKDKNLMSRLGNFGRAIGGFFGGALESVGSSITNIVSSAALESDNDIKDVRKIGTIAYLKVHYNNILAEYGYKVDFKTGELKRSSRGLGGLLRSVASTVGTTLGNFYGGFAGSLGKTAINLIGAGSMENDEEILKVRRYGTRAYLQLYYDSILKEYGYKVNYDTGEIKRTMRGIGGTVKALAGFVGNIVSGTLHNLFGNNTSKVKNSIEKLMMAESLENDSDIKRVRVQGTAAILTAYYDSMESAFDGKKASSLAKKIVNKLNSRSGAIVDSMVASGFFNMSLSKGESSGAVATSIGKFFSVYFDNLSKQVEKHPNQFSWSGSQKKRLREGMTQGLISAVLSDSLLKNITSGVDMSEVKRSLSGILTKFFEAFKDREDDVSIRRKDVKNLNESLTSSLIQSISSSFLDESLSKSVKKLNINKTLVPAINKYFTALSEKFEDTNIKKKIDIKEVIKSLNSSVEMALSSSSLVDILNSNLKSNGLLTLTPAIIKYFTALSEKLEDTNIKKKIDIDGIIKSLNSSVGMSLSSSNLVDTLIKSDGLSGVKTLAPAINKYFTALSEKLDDTNIKKNISIDGVINSLNSSVEKAMSSSNLVDTLNNNLKSGGLSGAKDSVGGFFSEYFDALKTNVSKHPNKWSWGKETIDVFNKSMASVVPNMYSGEITTTIMNSTPDYTGILQSMSAQVSSIKSDIENLKVIVRGDLTDNVKTIANNSGNKTIVSASGGQSFGYYNSEPKG